MRERGEGKERKGGSEEEGKESEEGWRTEGTVLSMHNPRMDSKAAALSDN